MADTLLKYIVDIQNSEKMKELVDEIKKGKDAVAALNAQMQQGAMTQQQFLAQARPLAAQIKQSTEEMNKLKVASGFTGQGLMQLGYAVDDLQYGFSAIVNNIPQIAMGFGISGGIAGAAAIAAVAISQLWKHMGDLQDIFQSAWSGSTIEQLHAIRVKAEEATEAFEKLSKVPTKMEKAGAEVVGEFTTENFEGLFQGLTEAIAQDPALKSNIDSGRRFADDMKRDADRRMEANRKTASEMLVQAQKPGAEGEQARANIRRLSGQFPGAFPKGTAEAFSPEAAEEKRVKEENIRADIQGRKNIREYDKKEAAERERLNKILTETGEKYEKEGKIEQLQDEKEYVEKELAKAKRGMTGSQRQQLEDEIIGSRQPQEAKIMSTKAYVNATMTAAGSQIPQQQLGHLKSMDDRIKEIAKEIKNYGKLQ